VPNLRVPHYVGAARGSAYAAPGGATEVETPDESSRRRLFAWRRALLALIVALLLFAGWLAGSVVRETLAQHAPRRTDHSSAVRQTPG
jgi:hypothetical protein